MTYPYFFPALFLMIAIFSGSVFYLVNCLKNDRQLISLIGLFCMAMGILLLVMDLVLISFTHGPRNIPDYLMFNRLVSDSGFAGRWVLTVYLFLSTGILISIYMLARNLFNKFNNSKNME